MFRIFYMNIINSHTFQSFGLFKMQSSKLLLPLPCIIDIELSKKSLNSIITSENILNNGLLSSSNSSLQQKQKWVTSNLCLCEGQRTRPFVVSVEGNISSGKSTFLEFFRKQASVETIPEPLGEWQHVGSHNLLAKAYEDPQRWSFLFQSYVQLTRLKIHLKNSENSVKLIERSFHNNRACFIEAAHKMGHINKAEYDILCEFYAVLEKELNIDIDLIVYLRTSPEVVYSRMQARGRSEEEGVPLTYLQEIHKQYEKWLIHADPIPTPAPVLIIDANKDLESLHKEYSQKADIILGKEPLP